MKASVIIPTYNRSEYLKDTISCLEKQTIPSDQFEILIVDNSLDARFKNIIEPMKKNNIRYIWEKRPGAHRARNTGALEAKGEILLFIDDDELFDQNLLHFMIESFNDKRIGCTGGKMLPQFEVDTFPDHYSIFHRGDITHLDFGDEPHILKDPKEIWGGNMAVRRDVYLKVGGMNPDIFPDKLMWLTGDGECGLQYKIRKAGYEIFYEPRACVYNRIGASRLTKEFLISRRTYIAITMSFTNIRMLKNRPFFLFQIIKHAIRCYVNFLYYSFIKKFSTSFERKIEALFWHVRSEHHFRAFFNKKLRNYILQDSYL